jgi:hypothetical protein
MSLFANLNGGGIKGPDVVINGDGGSLLPTSSSGMRFSSAKINQQDKLLGGIAPYHYGQGSVSDDIAQQVTPHKVQKIVPQFMLPSAANDANCADIELCHGVDDGDLAFTVRMVCNQATRLKGWGFCQKQNISRAFDPIINLATVNYILRGLQTPMGSNNPSWASFLLSTGWPIGDPTYTLNDFREGPYQHRNVSMFIQDFIRPLGVVIGSQNQGGQHQGSGGGAVDFPVDHVVTILVDGLCDNMLNMWKRADIRAGDDLLLVLCGYQMQADTHVFSDNGTTTCITRDVGPLKHQINTSDSYCGGIDTKSYVPPAAHTSYVLNHWPTGKITQKFANAPNLLFELVPTTSSEIDEGTFLGDDRWNRGMWHIARSQVQIRAAPTKMNGAMQTHRNDNANLVGGSLVQSTIAPVWKSAASGMTLKHHGAADPADPGVFHGSPAYSHNRGSKHIDKHKLITDAAREAARANFKHSPGAHSYGSVPGKKVRSAHDIYHGVTAASSTPQYMKEASSAIKQNTGAVKRIAEDTIAAEFEISKRPATTVKRSVLDTSMEVQDTDMDDVGPVKPAQKVYARSLTTNSAQVSVKTVSVAKVKAVAKNREP